MLFDEKNLISTTAFRFAPSLDLHIINSPITTKFLMVDKINLDLFTFGQITVSWTVENTVLDFNLFSAYIERSGSPEGAFTRLNAVGLKNVFTYIDEDASYLGKYRFIYYRIVTVRDAIQEATRTDVKTFYDDPDLIGLEIARRNKLLLDGFVGTKCVLYKRKHWGARCQDCWDNTLKRITKSKCLSCMDTGYDGGYWSPIQIQANFNPSPSIIQEAPWGLTEPSATSAWTGNYPLIETMDIIIELTRNRRWAVTEHVAIEKRRVPIKQILKLEEMEKGRVEFALPTG